MLSIDKKKKKNVELQKKFKQSQIEIQVIHFTVSESVYFFPQNFVMDCKYAF